jgi:hypothetical protein
MVLAAIPREGVCAMAAGILTVANDDRSYIPLFSHTISAEFISRAVK